MAAAGLVSGSVTVIRSLNDLLWQTLKAIKQIPAGNQRQSPQVDAGQEVGLQNLMGGSEM